MEKSMEHPLGSSLRDHCRREGADSWLEAEVVDDGRNGVFQTKQGICSKNSCHYCMHIQARIGLDSMHKTCRGSNKTQSQHGGGGYTKSRTWMGNHWRCIAGERGMISSLYRYGKVCVAPERSSRHQTKATLLRTHGQYKLDFFFFTFLNIFIFWPFHFVCNVSWPYSPSTSHCQLPLPHYSSQQVHHLLSFCWVFLHNTRVSI